MRENSIKNALERIHTTLYLSKKKSYIINKNSFI